MADRRIGARSWREHLATARRGHEAIHNALSAIVGNPDMSRANRADHVARAALGLNQSEGALREIAEIGEEGHREVRQLEERLRRAEAEAGVRLVRSLENEEEQPPTAGDRSSRLSMRK